MGEKSSFYILKLMHSQPVGSLINPDREVPMPPAQVARLTILKSHRHSYLG